MASLLEARPIRHARFVPAPRGTNRGAMRATRRGVEALLLAAAAASAAACSVPRGYVLRPKGIDQAGAAVVLEEGIASWYGEDFHGRPTASGEVFDRRALTAAHPRLPLGTLVEITNLSNGRAIVVRINDRGPFRKGRILDLSREGAKRLGFLDEGLARVRVSVRRMAPNPSYVVQVGSFLDARHARDLAITLTKGYDRVRVMTRSLAGTTYHRVRVGRFSSLDEAGRCADRLDRAGLDPLIVRDLAVASGAFSPGI